jgi:hypothetical protein
MRFLLSFIWAAVFAVLLTPGCRRSDSDALRYVPDDASAVLVLTPRVLLEKAQWDSFRKESLPELLEGYLGKYGMAFLHAPDSSGVDLSKPLYVSLRFSPNDVENAGYVLSLPLSDADRFSAFLARHGLPDVALETNMSLRFAEETHFLRIEKNTAVYVWGKNLWKPWAEDLLEGKNRSLSENPDFMEVARNQHDLWLWSSADPLAGDKVLQTGLAMVGLDSALLKGNHPLVYADFTGGEMKLGLDYRLAKGVHEWLDPLFGDRPQNDFSSLVAREKLAALVAFSAQPDALRAFLAQNAETTGLWFNDLLQPFGTDASTLLSNLQGDVFAAAYETLPEETPDVLFGAACKDERAATALLEILKKTPGGRPAGSCWQHPQGFFVGASGPRLLLGTTRQRLEKALSGGYSPEDRLDAATWQSLSGVAGLYLSPPSVGQWLLGAYGAGSDAALADRLEGAGGLVERRTLHFSLRFRDKSRNGLSQWLALMADTFRATDSGEVNLEDLMREEGTW